jgi:hypothetical protein
MPAVRRKCTGSVGQLRTGSDDGFWHIRIRDGCELQASLPAAFFASLTTARQPIQHDFGRKQSSTAPDLGIGQLVLTAKIGTRGETVGEYPLCLRLLRDLRDEADGWMVLFVREAIERGHTWADVGEMLGVSRQTAHEKYAPLILALARQTVEQET